MEALFRAYFAEGRDVCNQQVLSEIATQAGLSEPTLTAFKSGTSGGKEVHREEVAAQRRGISGVPTFLLDGAALFSGALRPEEMACRLKEAPFGEALTSHG